ncbi:type IX secretion system plug protein domain-containing protein, partial [Tenacibaculum piscium]
MTKILFIFLCCATHLSGIAQHIKTIQLRPKQATNQFSAIVPLGSVLSLSFDDLDGDTKEYQYKIEQMTHDWKPSNLLSNQYIEGFNQDVITKVSNAFNT